MKKAVAKTHRSSLFVFRMKKWPGQNLLDVLLNLGPPPKILNQNLFDVVVSSGIGIFHSDQLKAVVPANFLFFSVPLLDDRVIFMFLAIQLNGQNRDELLAALPLIHHKIKPAGIKQIAVTGVILKHMGNRHFAPHRVPFF